MSKQARDEKEGATEGGTDKNGRKELTAQGRSESGFCA